MYTDERFAHWLAHATEDPDLLEEMNLLRLRQDTAAITDRFFRRLPMAEYGLFGPMGAGSNRINIYTIRTAAQAMATHHKRLREQRPVAIGFDGRPKAQLFAAEAARVLAANGIFVWLFPQAMPAPAMASCIPRLSCGGGVYITGGHLPWQYSGLRIHGADGARLPKPTAQAITRRMAALDPFKDIRLTDYDAAAEIGMIRTAPSVMPESYLAGVLRQFPAAPSPSTPLRVAVSPLFGTSAGYVHNLLAARGTGAVQMVPEKPEDVLQQSNALPLDPQNPEALQPGLRFCRSIGADLLLATDPASSRVGAAVKDGDAYRLLSGHELGVLLLDHLCRLHRRAEKPLNTLFAAKSLEASSLATQVAQSYGVALHTLPPNFKAAGHTLEAPPANHKKAFTLAFDGAGGFVLGRIACNRDANAACAWICDMAQAQKAAGHTLADALRQIYLQYGFYANTHHRYGPSSIENALHMQNALKTLRLHPYETIAGVPITSFTDYRRSRPAAAAGTSFREDLLEYRLKNDGRIVIYPTIDHSAIHVHIETSSFSETTAQKTNQKLAKGIHNLLCAQGGLSQSAWPSTTSAQGFPERIPVPAPVPETAGAFGKAARM